MKPVKIGKRVFALLLLGGFLFLSVFCNLPYRYPAYPGTPEWETLEVEERWEIGHVPLFRIRMMSTNALLCTFLTHHELFMPLSNGYPLDPTYWMGKGYSAENDELYPMVRELLSRPDAGEVLLRTYQAMPLYPPDDELSNTDKLVWMEFLLTLPPVKNQFTKEEQAEIDAAAEKKIQQRVKAGLGGEWACQYYMETYTPGHWHEFIKGEYVPAQWDREKVEETLSRFQ